jgi:hypothetical protein
VLVRALLQAGIDALLLPLLLLLPTELQAEQLELVHTLRHLPPGVIGGP